RAAAAAEELRPAGRDRGGRAPARCAHGRKAGGAGRARRAREPPRARVPEPALRPALHPGPGRERRGRPGRAALEAGRLTEVRVAGDYGEDVWRGPYYELLLRFVDGHDLHRR